MNMYDENLPPRRRRKRKSRRLRVFIIVLAVIVAAAAVGYKLLVVRPDAGDDLSLHTPGTSTTAAPKGEDDDDDDTMEASDAGLKSADKNRRPNVFTFVVIATDKEDLNTDVMMVGTLDTDADTLDIVSIPRDTLVNVPWYTKKVNSLYASGGEDHEDRIQALKDGLRDILGYSVDHYVFVDMEGFEALVDKMGGIYFDVPIDMYYYDWIADYMIDIKAGYQLLDGSKALQVMRFRSGYVDADIGRIHTQQEFLKVAAKELISSVSITNIPSYANIFKEYVDTSYSVPNLIWMGLEFLKLDDDDIVFHTMPGDASVIINNVWYVSIYLDEWLELLNDRLSPYNDKVEIKEENLNILMSDSRGIHSTTGVIEGGPNSFASAYG